MPGQPRIPGQPAARDPRLAGFTLGGEWDTKAPGADLTAVLAAAAGPEFRCPESTDDELVGVLRRWAAVESWAAAAKLGVIRELIRRDGHPSFDRPRHGDLPDKWSDSLNNELAMALSCSAGAAEKTALTAWELGARLPRIAAMLADGRLTYSKARLAAETFQWLSDDDAARADELLADRLSETALVTFGQLVNLTARIAAQVDPGFAGRRRKLAVKANARVRLFREDSGAAGLSGRDLPPDETLAANANVCARATEYKDSGAFDDARMDACRATAYLDLLNEIPAWERIASGRLVTFDGNEDPGETGNEGEPGDPSDPEDGSWGDSTGPGDPQDDGPGDVNDSGGPGGAGTTSGIDRASRPAPRRPVDLVIPLATLLGLAERPGEGHGFGVLDPDLCRSLADLAVASPHTTLCVTITDLKGIAIGHGCARPRKPTGIPPEMTASDGAADIGGTTEAAGTADPSGRPPPMAAIPARINLTMTAELLAVMRSGRQRAPGFLAAAGWAFAAPGDPVYGDPVHGDPIHGDPARGVPVYGDQAAADPVPGELGWCGVWTLTLPGGRQLAVRLEPVPTYGCDHDTESHGYQPSEKLRHLVQVRDYTCTNPVCSRHARESDFEHAEPYLKGGRTCACNAGARSRRCHRIKQSPGWSVTQPRPGWHQWVTPAGRVYTREPWHYPV
jgi:hypothetical protein